MKRFWRAFLEAWGNLLNLHPRPKPWGRKIMGDFNRAYKKVVDSNKG